MEKRGKGSLVLVRVVAIVFVILVLVFFIVLPAFLGGKFNLVRFLGERIFNFEDGKKASLSPPGPCINLDNPDGVKVTKSQWGTATQVDFFINDNVLLCPGTYNYEDQAAADGVLIINADDIELDCNGAVISNPFPNQDRKAISITSKNNIKINYCNTTGFGYGVYADNMANSLINSSTFFGFNQFSIYLVSSSNNHINNINATSKPNSYNSAEVGIRIDRNSKNNIINNSFIYDTALNAIYTEGNGTQVHQTKIVNSSMEGDDKNGAIRIHDAVSNFIDNVNITRAVRGIVTNCAQYAHLGNNVIKNVNISIMKEQGIQIRINCTRTQIDNAFIFNATKRGISIEASNVTLNNSVIYNTYPTGLDAGLYISSLSSVDLCGATCRQGPTLEDILIQNTKVVNSTENVIFVRSANVTFINVLAHNASGSGNNVQFSPGVSSEYISRVRALVIDSDFNDSMDRIDVLLGQNPGGVNNITFLNSSFNTSQVNGGSYNAQFTVKWWVDVKAVDYVGNPLANVNISALSIDEQLWFSELTDANGMIPKENVTEIIVRIPTARYYFNNYTIKANLVSVFGTNMTRTVNISSSKSELFRFSDVDFISPFVQFSSKTEPNGTFFSRNWIFIDVDIIEDNLRNVIFDLYDYGGSLIDSLATAYHYGFDLSRYKRVLNNSDLALEPELSSITYNPVSDTLFTAHAYGDTGTNRINEISRDGNLIRVIQLTGFQDVEGIAYINTSVGALGTIHRFAITEERRARMAHIWIRDSTTSIDISEVRVFDLGLGNLGNSGLEGVTYDVGRDLHYLVKEKQPKKLYRVNVSRTPPVPLTIEEIFDPEVVFSDFIDIGDLFYDNNTDSLFVLSDQSKGIANVYLNGTRIGEVVSLSDMFKPEGVTFDRFGDYMYAAGETDAFTSWKIANYSSKRNFTNLVSGIYHYRVNVSDVGFNDYLTETRTIILDMTSPALTFIEPPTPANGATVTTSPIEIDTDITEQYLKRVTFNWNGVGYNVFDSSTKLLMNFDNVAALGEDYSTPSVCSNGVTACTVATQATDCASIGDGLCKVKIIDMSGNGNNGVVKNAIYTATGKYLGGFSFNNNQDYIDINDGDRLDFESATEDFSVFAWVKTMNTVQGAAIMQKLDGLGDGWRLVLLDNANNGKVRASLNAIEVESSIKVNDGQWHYVGLVADRDFSGGNSELRLYVDGELRGSSGLFLNQPMNIELQHTRMGVASYNPIYSDFDGEIDEVMVWDRVLTVNEIKQLYISNLRKENTNKWRLNVAKVSANGVYTFQTFAEDKAGNIGNTELRSINVDIPQILSISKIPVQRIVPNGVRNVVFDVTVQSGNPISNVRADFTSPLGTIRSTPSCLLITIIDAVTFVYRCTIGVYYYDAPGLWSVYAQATDSLSGTASKTSSFVLMSTRIISHPSSTSWGTLLLGEQNKYASLQLDNIGNDPILDGQIEVTPLDLWKDNTITSPNIPASLMTANIANPATCGGNGLSNSINQIIGGALLSVYNGIGGGRSENNGQETLHFCITTVPSGLPAGNYQAAGGRSWQLTLPDFDPGIPASLEKFYVRDSVGNAVAYFGSNGDVVLKGSCTIPPLGQNCNNAPADSFIIKDSLDDVKAYVSPAGNMCIEDSRGGACADSVYINQVSCDPTAEAFVVQVGTTNMTYIDFNGRFCAVGGLYENQNTIE